MRDLSTLPFAIIMCIPLVVLVVSHMGPPRPLRRRRPHRMERHYARPIERDWAAGRDDRMGDAKEQLAEALPLVGRCLVGLLVIAMLIALGRRYREFSRLARGVGPKPPVAPPAAGTTGSGPGSRSSRTGRSRWQW